MTRRTMLLVLISLSGCSRGRTREELLNRKVLDAILTAITLRNLPELERDVKLLDERRAAGQISQPHYKMLQEIVAAARCDDWSAAEDQLYQFREAHPFVR